MEKLLSFLHFGNISTDSECPPIIFFFNWSSLSVYIAIKIQKSTKHPIFLMVLLLQKQFFEKNITGEGL